MNRNGGSLGEEVFSPTDPLLPQPSLTLSRLHTCPALSVGDLVQLFPVFLLPSVCPLSLVSSTQPTPPPTGSGSPVCVDPGRLSLTDSPRLLARQSPTGPRRYHILGWHW